MVTLSEAIEVYDGMKQRFAAASQAGQVVKPCKYEAELDAASKELEKFFDMPVGLLCVAEGIRVMMRELEEKRTELLALKIANATLRRGERAVIADLRTARDDMSQASEEFMTVMKESLLWRIARLMRGTDELSATAFGVQGGNLLIELMTIDPYGYEQNVRGNLNANESTNGAVA